MRLYLVLLGPPGAGKGTQTHRLCAGLGLFRVATGDLLRRIAQEAHPLAARVRSVLEAGRLVDDATVWEVVSHYLDRAAETYEGVVLDGYPRSLAQADQLEDYLTRRGQMERLWCVLLDLPETVAVRRLAGRRICPRCERIYNVDRVPPDGRCEVCATPLIQRADDTEAIIQKRFQVYWEQTAPLVQYYETRGRLVRLDADQPEDQIFECLAGYVRSWLTHG
ncbi:MAG: nucleoside monophosphate kinase [Acidobacteria bacterium]|nr:nucleoside monophosphate kinase [Acidobacteriota bacterium]MDW7985478.1 nucleoside monophosphate kinase [Acidobacteriota bacterium]